MFYLRQDNEIHVVYFIFIYYIYIYTYWGDLKRLERLLVCVCADFLFVCWWIFFKISLLSEATKANIFS